MSLAVASLLAALIGVAVADDAAAPTQIATTTQVAREAIRFQEPEAAAAQSAAQERVLALYFTADWCGWCRRMESSTFTDAGVIAAGHDLSWAKVDIDERADFAAAFGVYGVPTVAFVNADGELLGRHVGYLPAAPMQELLARYHGKALAPGLLGEGLASLDQVRTALAAATSDEAFAAAVRQALDLLADPQRRAQREQVRHAIITFGSRAWPAIVAALADDRLAVRAAAGDVLRSSAPAAPSVDPFADAGQRDAQLADTRRWLAAQVPIEADDHPG